MCTFTEKYRPNITNLPTPYTYTKSTLYINSEYLALFCALLIDHFELKTKISVRNFETAGPVITRYLALYFYINNILCALKS